jgi:hypothetical protein
MYCTKRGMAVTSPHVGGVFQRQMKRNGPLDPEVRSHLVREGVRLGPCFNVAVWPAHMHSWHSEMPFWRHLGPLIQKESLGGALAHRIATTQPWLAGVVIIM